MCDECLKVPCDPRCPNAPEPPVICLCGNCGDEIHKGDEIYDFEDYIWCKHCVDKCFCVADSEDI